VHLVADLLDHSSRFVGGHRCLFHVRSTTTTTWLSTIPSKSPWRHPTISQGLFAAAARQRRRQKRQKNRQHELELLQRHEQHAYPLAETAVEWVQQTIQGRGSDGNQHLQAALEDPIHWNYTIRDYSGTVYPVGNFTKWYYGQPDNYNVRMICGVRCTHIAKYRLSRELFRYALQRLTDFAHVIFVEDMEASFAAFARHYGWQYNVAAAHHGQRLNATDLTSALQQQHSDWDPYMSVLDDALYEFAQRKYLGATKEDLKALMKKGVEFANQALVDEYFEKGPGRDCPNECCGVCSKW
jgi:hypothetical protein